MPLGTEVGLVPGDIAIDGDPASPTESGTAAPSPLFIGPCLFRPMSIVAKRSPISATAELLFYKGSNVQGYWYIFAVR